MTWINDNTAALAWATAGPRRRDRVPVRLRRLDDLAGPQREQDMLAADVMVGRRDNVLRDSGVNDQSFNAPSVPLEPQSVSGTPRTLCTRLA